MENDSDFRKGDFVFDIALNRDGDIVDIDSENIYVDFGLNIKGKYNLDGSDKFYTDQILFHDPGRKIMKLKNDYIISISKPPKRMVKIYVNLYRTKESKVKSWGHFKTKEDAERAYKSYALGLVECFGVAVELEVEEELL